MSRTALLMAAGATLAACTTTSQFEAPKPNFPVQTPTESAPAAAATPAQGGDEPPPQARPTAPVESRPIEPPQPGPGASLSPRNGLIRVANTTAAVAPRSESTTRTVTGGRVVDVEVEAPGKTHKVKDGETLYRIALGFGMKPEELAKLNGLKPPWVIRPGQVLKGPGAKTKSKAYVVGEGDTLGAVAQRFSVGVAALASTNDLKSTASLRPGQRLKLPAGYKDKGPQTVTVVRSAPAAPPPVRAAAAPPPPPRPAPSFTPAVSPAPPPLEPQPPRTQLAATAPASASSLSVPPSAALPPPMAANPPPSRLATPSMSAPPPRQGPPPTASPPPMSRQAPPPARAVADPPRQTTLASAQPIRPPYAPPPAARPAPAQPSSSALVPSAPPAGDSQVASLGRGRFVWPVRGQVISG
ncbi:LysM peptidoglycan-binding domain-containing protein, partial [Phenylobacterium sp.]|uniref:LysM peptidoglycan-binding domain-containing protein n=1 Tax=Phenylobacterium sp. TaxID=1871053 RepID=UPI002E36CCFE